MVGDEVAGDLVDNKLVIREIVIEGVDDPVAVEPDEAGGVLFVAVGVGKARGVEPDAGPTFAVMGRGEEALDLLFVSTGGLVGEIRIDFVGSGREAGEVEGETPEKGDAIGFGRGFETFPCRDGRG